MNDGIIICPMCGHRFNAKGNSACQACPLNSGCQMVCCPVCGYQTINPEGSALARMASQLFVLKKHDSQVNKPTS